jgi:hypothetical protein
MRQKNRIITAIIAIVAIAALLRINIVADRVGGIVYSQGNEVYFFIAESHTGYRFSYLQYPFFALLEIFGWVPEPEAEWECMKVIHVTSTNLDAQTSNCGGPYILGPTYVTPFADGFYALCRGGQICKLSDAGFVSPAKEEPQGMPITFEQLVRGVRDNQVIDGWQAHYFPGAEHEFQISLGNGAVVIVSNDATPPMYPRLKVVVSTRDTKIPKLVYQANAKPQWVSKTQYNHVFQR